MTAHERIGVKARLATITEELTRYQSDIDSMKLEEFIELLQSARRVFAAGAGKSGLAARALANRLMHLGLNVHVPGEISCPSIRQGDLLVVNSGSGSTSSMLTSAETAKKEGAMVVLFTHTEQSPIGELADLVVVVPAEGKIAADGSTIESVQTLGSLFEDLCLLSYDAIVAELMAVRGETAKSMAYRHTNLE